MIRIQSYNINEIIEYLIHDCISYIADIPAGLTYDELYTAIYNRMTGTQEMDTAEISDTSTPGLIPYRGNNPSVQVISACCSALAHYINVETA